MSEDPNKIFTPGMSIENKSATADDYAAIGCFARTTSDGATVLLSCAHTMFANLSDEMNLKIWSPPSSSTCCRHRHIADTLNRWIDGFGDEVSMVEIGIPEEVYDGYETDCAIARVRAGVLYSNEHPLLGMITGTPASGLGVSAPPPWGTPPSPEQLVRFISPETGRVHYGTILEPDPRGAYADGSPLDPLLWPLRAGRAEHEALPNIGQLVVMPRPAPGEALEPYLKRQRSLYFGQTGDSGSVVVNHQNQVIGMLVRAGGPKPSLDLPHPEWAAVTAIGIVSPIQKVLDRMRIEIPPNFAKTTQSAGAAIHLETSDASGDPDELALERGQKRVGDELRKTRIGRLLLGKLQQHRLEVRRLVEGHRQVRVAWHRNEGPALVSHCVRNLRDPAHVVPTSINGVDRQRLMRVMADLLRAHGSPKLRRDVETYQQMVMEHAASITTLDEVPPRLNGLRRQRLGLDGQGDAGGAP